MDIISTYRDVGSYRGAAQLCGTTHKTVKRTVEKFEADQAGHAPPPRAERDHNYDAVADLVTERIEKSQGRISAKRLLPIARTAGYDGSDRNFVGLSPTLKQCGAQTITAGVDRRCGHRVTTWLSTGRPSAACTCSAR
jgi:hypothetical protein